MTDLDLSRLWSPNPPWMKDAACRGLNPNLFFPERGQSTDTARAVCATCPVSAECLQQAIDDREPGVWGGMSARQRRLANVGKGTRGSKPGSTPIRHGRASGYAAHRRRGEDPCTACRTAYNAYHAADKAERRAS